MRRFIILRNRDSKVACSRQGLPALLNSVTNRWYLPLSRQNLGIDIRAEVLRARKAPVASLTRDRDDLGALVQ